MKKIYLTLTLLVTVVGLKSFAQDSTAKQTSPVLTAYYHLKNALVGTNATAAASGADELVKTINEASLETVNAGAKEVLLKDATLISQSNDIKLQREKFASLSSNMFELAKSVKLSDAPVYQQYCPMKKASWLSKDKDIKNPYYGSAMLTCGSVKTTF